MFNNKALAAIISDYKQNFEQIHKEEIYKWKAVKCFQDNWDWYLFTTVDWQCPETLFDELLNDGEIDENGNFIYIGE